MKARSCVATTVLAVLLAPGIARGQGIEGRFSLAFQAGIQSELSGDFLKGVDGTLLGKPVSIQSKRYRDVYPPEFHRFQGQLGYGVGERAELIARFTYYKVDGNNLEVGTLDGKPLGMYFDENGEYEEVGFEAGLRFYVATTGRLKSYLAPIVGARRIGETLVSFSSQEAATSILNVPWSQKSTVPVFGLDLGFTYDFGESFFVGVDTGLRYQSAPKQFDGFEGPAGANDSGPRWTAPVVASIGVRF